MNPPTITCKSEHVGPRLNGPEPQCAALALKRARVLRATNRSGIHAVKSLCGVYVGVMV